jgi:osmoprotectant transport system permease protein
MAILKLPVEPNPRRAWSTVRREFAARHALTWLAPMAFDNTYALAVTTQKARSLGLARISDLARHRGLIAGFASEFMAREDGYPGLLRHYGLELDARGMEAGLMYGAVAAGKVDVISAYATDGRIDKFELVVLEDDRGFFPPYQAAPLVRRAALEEFPEMEPALAVLAGKLSDAEMRRWNAAVDIEGRTPESVARAIVEELLAPAN